MNLAIQKYNKYFRIQLGIYIFKSLHLDDIHYINIYYTLREKKFTLHLFHVNLYDIFMLEMERRENTIELISEIHET